jgi:hypothetical protein
MLLIRLLSSVWSLSRSKIPKRNNLYQNPQTIKTENIMSINSLANTAVARRPDFSPFESTPKGVAEIAVAAAVTPAADTVPTPPTPPSPPKTGAQTAIDTAMHVLFGYIPTEILTLYVAVLAAIQQPNRTAQTPPSRGEWISFFVFLVATPLVVWLVYGAKIKAAQKPLPISFGTWPIWEMFAATVAYCAWAFALPNTPFTIYSWYTAGLAGITVLVASTVLGLLAPFFQRPLSA